MDELLYYDLKDVSGLTPGLATQVCREVGRRIIAGHFPEGQFIDDENKLCERFNVSKSVVREAVKILVSKDNYVLGAHIIGSNATEMISEFSLAMRNKLSVENILDSIHPHPTFSEAIFETLMQLK